MIFLSAFLCCSETIAIIKQVEAAQKSNLSEIQLLLILPCNDI